MLGRKHENISIDDIFNEFKTNDELRNDPAKALRLSEMIYIKSKDKVHATYNARGYDIRPEDRDGVVHTDLTTHAMQQVIHSQDRLHKVSEERDQAKDEVDRLTTELKEYRAKAEANIKEQLELLQAVTRKAELAGARLEQTDEDNMKLIQDRNQWRRTATGRQDTIKRYARAEASRREKDLNLAEDREDAVEKNLDDLEAILNKCLSPNPVTKRQRTRDNIVELIQEATYVITMGKEEVVGQQEVLREKLTACKADWDSATPIVFVPRISSGFRP